jgi:TusA-related sulfurtransferase
MTAIPTQPGSSKEIDARGSFCPGPLLELIRHLKTASVSDTLEVLSSDAGSITDIPAWVNKARHELVGIEDMGGGVKRISVRKAH